MLEYKSVCAFGHQVTVPVHVVLAGAQKGGAVSGWSGFAAGSGSLLLPHLQIDHVRFVLIQVSGRINICLPAPA